MVNSPDGNIEWARRKRPGFLEIASQNALALCGQRAATIVTWLDQVDTVTIQGAHACNKRRMEQRWRYVDIVLGNVMVNVCGDSSGEGWEQARASDVKTGDARTQK